MFQPELSGEHNTNGSFGQDENLPALRPLANSLQARIDLRTRNTEKGKLKGLDKTIFLFIVSDSIFIFCSNATKTFEILMS